MEKQPLSPRLLLAEPLPSLPPFPASLFLESRADERCVLLSSPLPSPFPCPQARTPPAALAQLWDAGEDTLVPGSNPTPAITGCAALDEVLHFSEPPKKNKMEFKISTSLAASNDNTKKALKCRRL